MNERTVAILGQASPTDGVTSWRQLQNQWMFTGQELMPVWSLLIIAVMLLGAIGSVYLWRRYHSGSMHSTPTMIFHEVARRSGLKLRDQWLLFQIARQQALPTPLTLLLAAGTMRSHSARYIQSLKPSRRTQAQARIDAIYRILFQQPLSGSIDSQRTRSWRYSV